MKKASGNSQAEKNLNILNTKTINVTPKKVYLLLSILILIIIIVVAVTQCSKKSTVSSVANDVSEISTSQTDSLNTSSSSASNSTASASSAKQEASAASEQSKIKLINITPSVSPGSEASVTVQGQSNTVYHIDIHDNSGDSKAARLEDKTSDSNGIVTWTWEIGKKANSGTCQIVITGANQTFPIDIPIQK